MKKSLLIGLIDILRIIYLHILSDLNDTHTFTFGRRKTSLKRIS